MAEIGEQALDAVEDEIDAFGVELKQPLEDDVASRGDGHAAPTDCGEISDIGGDEASVAIVAWLVSSRTRRDSISRIWWRCTTISTMPWSRRYSARWKPSGNRSRIVCSMTRWPVKPMSAPGSAMWMSPSMA